MCGEELVEKQGEKLLKGGTNTAAVEVDTLVCLRCGEKIRNRLSRNETDELTLIGDVYKVPRA